MNLFKKLLCLNTDLNWWGNLILVLKRTFTYYLPILTFTYSTIIEKLTNEEVSIMAKLGAGGIVAIVCFVLILVYFVKKGLKSKIDDLTDKLIECTDLEQKKALVQEKRETRAKLEIFNNIIFVVPFVVALFLVILIEQKMIAVKGVLFGVIIELVIGLGLNVYYQKLLNEV